MHVDNFSIFCDASVKGRLHFISANVRSGDKVLMSTERILPAPTDEHNSNHAEAAAISLALSIAKDIFTDFPYSNVTIFSDSQSAVGFVNNWGCRKAMRGAKRAAKNLRKSFLDLRSYKCLSICWVKRDHAGIKFADRKCNKLAKNYL